MSDDGTRGKLLRAAERLMAERGVDAVSFAEITAAAGQRNNSAVPYYFGDRRGLLRAILERHREPIAERRTQLLDEIDAAPTLRELVIALVAPIAHQVRYSEGGGDYARIVAHLLGHPEIRPTVTDLGLTRTNRRLDIAMVRATKGLPPLLLAIRMDLVITLLFNGLVGQGGSIVGSTETASYELFVENLVDTIEAVLAASPSPATIALVPADSTV